MIRITIIFCLLSHFLIAQNQPEFSVCEDFSSFQESYLDNISEPTIINFWATWCKPCVEELPFFQEYHQTQNPPKIILVSLDFKHNYVEKLNKFLAKNKIDSEIVVLLDEKYNNWLDLIDPAWSGSIPATLFLNENKSHFYEGSFSSFDEIKLNLKKVK